MLYYHMALAMATFHFKVLNPNSGYKAQRERKRACGRDTAGEAQLGLKVSNEKERLKEKYAAKVVDFVEELLKEYEVKVVVAFEEELPKELETNLVDFAADCVRPKEEKPLKEYEAKEVDFAADCGRLKAEEPLEENEAKLLDFLPAGDC